MPAEEEKEKKKKDDSKEEWVESGGGFIPKILRRNKNKSDLRTQVTPVMTLQEYKAVVADENEKMVVVRFHATWCRSCRAAAPFFFKLADKYSPEVKFVEVPLTKETAFLHEGLGVPSVPFAHIYHPDAGLVEEMKISKKNFSEFKKVFETYIAGSCDVADTNGSILLDEEDGFQ